VYDRIPLNLTLNRSVFNALIGQVSPDDYSEIRQFKHVDNEMASSLQFVLDTDLGDDGELLGLFFTATNETNYSEVPLK